MLPGYAAAPFPGNAPVDLFARTMPTALPGVNGIAHLQKLEHGVRRLHAEQYKDKGNDYRRLNLPDLAIDQYRKAIVSDPHYTDAYYNLARTYVTVHQPRQAIQTFQQLLQVDPQDFEARLTLAEQWIAVGQPQAARQEYVYILQRQPNYDSASRNLSLLNLRMTPGASPQRIQQAIRQQGLQVLRQAKSLLRQYYTQANAPIMLNVMDSIQYEFSPTQQIDQVANLAEYDHMQGRTVRFAPEMAFAHPNVVAAYMTHELIHARDNDTLTSILEEEDGYRSMARFWEKFKGNVAEPNIDLAASLYRESPDRLDLKVRELYTMRDPLIPEKSPGHGNPYRQNVAVTSEEQRLNKAVRYTQYIYDRIKSMIEASGGV